MTQVPPLILSIILSFLVGNSVVDKNGNAIPIRSFECNAGH